MTNTSVLVDDDTTTCLNVPKTTSAKSWVRIHLPKTTISVQYVYIKQNDPRTSPSLDVYIGDYGNQSDGACVSKNDFLVFGNTVACNGTFTGTYLTVYSSNAGVDLTLCEVKVLGSSKFYFVMVLIHLHRFFFYFFFSCNKCNLDK